MTRTHEAVLGALTPFCKAQTALARQAPARPTTSPTWQSRLKAAMDEHPSWDTDECAAFLKIMGVLFGQYVSGSAPSAFVEVARDITENGIDELETTQAGVSAWPVGSVAVVVNGCSRHKRVLGRGYIIITAGDRPTPLGLRGSSERNRPTFEPGDIRVASDAEIADTLTRLTAAQVKALVCDLSGREPFKAVLAGVINNPDNRCDCR